MNDAAPTADRTLFPDSRQSLESTLTDLRAEGFRESQRDEDDSYALVRMHRAADGAVAIVELKESAAKKAKLTKAQAAEVRSLVEDEGYTRAEAIAWVRFGGAQ